MATAAAQDGSQDDGRDLTGRARIRNAGLHLFAANGFAGTPLRSIAAEAGVAIGLISHHFGSKDGLREAVESWIIDLFDTAIDSADQQSADPVADAAGRDAAVARMLEDHPLVVDYLRRELLDSPDDRPLLTRLTALTRQSVDSMRATGLASTDRDRVEQVVTVMVRQLGKLFLQPLIDQIVDSFPAEERPAASPELSVEVSSAHR
ncbi:TetR/AcrR family transcriptional regulator [Brevibacterium sp.]|jgi:AcrR family transcriptional regulator|uniref:TetR/AcrR family transcriptional regulator n=1 Tax=Brevibacterium sp. TaxID=1701 RepID=UPI002637C142|nr:TetR/AcrR family transcriptional regulator [Brevibacterium sp.]